MAERDGWLGRLRAVVEREYERRIRAASLVTEYGVGHGAHQSHDDDDGAEILNLPRGARRPALHHEDTPAE
ncbi:hypothetical protein K2Z83_03850 [Oscillochloris sp. ZM17-4]|uniref:hypothetical protein n=1 Tax=Oscillochloris sp. ZM17-4 TaxID=2866714 RepID=UPI001C7397D3|nr:hypothetical protein [Oscillochloris sp. ZM17-4]MBX0326815.1 hypothetical protein [Oscillochloris sp. ZM17-4]